MVENRIYNLTLKENHTPEETHDVLLSSFHGALLGCVKRNVREVLILWNSVKEIKVVFVLDEQPSQSDLDVINEVTAGVYGDFPYHINIKEECICDLNKIIKYADDNYKYSALAFLRHEE